MGDTKKYVGLQDTIATKEKTLIDSISADVSEQLANDIQDTIKENLSASLDTFSEAITDAEQKMNGLQDNIQKLSKDVHSLQSHQFSEQLAKLSNAQQALTTASSNAKSSSEECQKADKELIQNIATTQQEWQEIRSHLAETVYELQSNTSEYTKSLQKLNTSINELRSSVATSQKQLSDIYSKLTLTLSNVEKDMNLIVDKSKSLTESNIRSDLTVLTENDKIVQSKLDELEKRSKISPVTIITAAMAGVLIVLNVISFFI